jgi:hypothetical protein
MRGQDSDVNVARVCAFASSSQKLDPLKIECILRHRTEYREGNDPNTPMCRDMTAFFAQKFQKG